MTPRPTRLSSTRLRSSTCPGHVGFAPVPARAQAVAQRAVHHRQRFRAKMIKVARVGGILQRGTWEIRQIELFKEHAQQLRLVMHRRQPRGGTILNFRVLQRLYGLNCGRLVLNVVVKLWGQRLCFSRLGIPSVV